MAKIVLVYCGVIMGLFFSGCSNSKKECAICGDFKLINLSKNEFNSTENPEVNARRNLTVGATNGWDYFTVWQWDKKSPDSSWSESFQKWVEIKQSRLTVNENGTWEWVLNVRENFAPSPFFGADYYQIEKNYSERGFWQFIDGNNEIVEFEIRENGVDNHIMIMDDENSDLILSESPFKSQKKRFIEPNARRFEINRNTQSGLLVLKTVDDDRNRGTIEIENTSYSLAEGNIFMTLSEVASSPKLVAKYK